MTVTRAIEPWEAEDYTAPDPQPRAILDPSFTEPTQYVLNNIRDLTKAMYPEARIPETPAMTKIAYNACYGGFSLSRAAIVRAREISGDPKWAGAILPGEMYDDGSGPCREFGFDSVHINSAFPRHDPVLVQVIEELGDAANGSCADLAIEELPSGTGYRIDEYDGNERVMTALDYEWTIAP